MTMTDAPDPRSILHETLSSLQQRAAAAGITLRPLPPEPTTCCGRGCNGCVWEAYDAALDYWREEALLKLQD